jgi:HD-like signal output (HDOD) protein
MEDAEITQNREAFGFVQSLATALSEGRVELPSYPEAAGRVQRALGGEDVDPEVVVRAISAEPALALRVMQMANSVLLNPMGRQVVDLRTAVSRIGYNMVRTTAMAFVLQQLRNAEQFRDLKPQLARLWSEGITMAALAHVIAQRHSRVNADTALLAGLLHGVGKLYILTRLKDHRGLQGYPEACERILSEWHAGVGRAILDNWGVPDEVGESVQEYQNLERELRGPVCLAEVLSGAFLLAQLRQRLGDERATQSDVEKLMEQNAGVWLRLTIGAPDGLRILQDASAEIATLNQVLGE